MRAGIVKPSEMSFWAELLLTVLLMMALMIVVVSIADAIAAALPERWDHLGHEAIEERAPVLGKNILGTKSISTPGPAAGASLSRRALTDPASTRSSVNVGGNPMRRPTAAAAGDLVAVVTDQGQLLEKIQQLEPELAGATQDVFNVSATRPSSSNRSRSCATAGGAPVRID
jgi:hypothetical protein